MNESRSLETLAQQTGIETTVLVQYQEHGLLRPSSDDDDSVRTLRRIEHLREACEMNFEGVKLLTHLLEQLEQLRSELRRRR